MARAGDFRGIQFLGTALAKLGVDTLEHLLDQILAFDTFEQVEQRLVNHQSVKT